MAVYDATHFCAFYVSSRAASPGQFLGSQPNLVATVGLTSTPFFSPTFTTSEDPSMFDRMNLKKALGRTIECDPTTLVSGGKYKTQMQGWTIKNCPKSRELHNDGPAQKRYMRRYPYKNGYLLMATILNIAMIARELLIDLGVNAPGNRLMNPERMRERLRTNLDPFKGTIVQWPESHNVDKVVANMAGYGIPLEAPQPVSLSARYVCHKLVWKKPTNLVIDVLVATVSLFMAYWALLNFSLSSIAVSSSPNGLYNMHRCDELPHHAAPSEAHELKLADDGPLYESIPTGSLLSTPP
ncbi:hypothetical protein BDV93DRAFT_514427 [Ceratobasidium sp. AG-I]|nr:hypothetical protein BDV93DRAFT_514427 [Ceratobasidium sp. AG-I]